MPATNTKIKAVKIVIDRAEGPCDLCGPKTFEGTECWEQAQACINNICLTAPKSGGYDKTDFKIWFADDETYDGRIDLKHPDHPCPEESNLANNIAQLAFFYMGLWRPDHLTPQQYQQCLNNLLRERPGVPEHYAQLLHNYEIPNTWNPPKMQDLESINAMIQHLAEAYEDTSKWMCPGDFKLDNS